MRNINAAAIGNDLLRSFCAVAEAGNITQAAVSLGRTQSAVSLQISRLEDLLGVRLFERRSRGVLLTEDGERLLPLAKKVLQDLDKVAALFSTPSPERRIRIGLPDDYNETILKSALDRFSERCGEVEVLVYSGCTSHFPEAIGRGDLDLAIYSAGPIAPEEAFFSEPTHWAAGKSFSLAEGAPVPVALLDRHCWWSDLASKALDEVGRTWRVAYKSENFDSLKSAIASGLAVGILAESAFTPAMRSLGEDEGFPELPRSSLKLLKSDKAPARLVGEMEEAIRFAI